MVHRAAHRFVQDILMKGGFSHHHPQCAQIIPDRVFHVTAFGRWQGQIGLFQRGPVLGAQAEEAVLDRRMVDERTDLHAAALRLLSKGPFLIGVPADLILASAMGPARIHDIDQINRGTTQLAEGVADRFFTQPRLLGERPNRDPDSIPTTREGLPHELEEHPLRRDRQRRESAIQVPMENREVLEWRVAGGA